MDNDKKGLLFVISGPSGVGKGTICKKLLDRRKDLKLSVSVTTRAPRPGEIEGVNYFFRSEEQFQDMIARDEFLEYMCVFGKNHYGTPKAYVAEQRARGNDVILEIDVNGALNVKKRCPDAVMIFIAPPSMETLKKRLVGRGTETEDAVERRFAEGVVLSLGVRPLDGLVKELAAAGEYDSMVVNDSLDKAVKDTESILVSERLHVSNNPKLINILKGE